MHRPSASSLRRRLAHLSLVVLIVAVTLAAFSHMACNGKRKPSAIQTDIAARQKRIRDIEKQLSEVHGSEYDASTGQFSRGYGGSGPLAITSTDLQAERQALINEHHDCQRDLADLQDELVESREHHGTHGSDVSRRGSGAAGSVNVPTGGAGHHH